MKNTITEAFEIGEAIGVTLEYFNLVAAVLHKAVWGIKKRLVLLWDK